jgi:exodeoxyribonuclease III
MQIISANLNGIRSANNKHFFEWMSNSSADVVCVQEIKAQEADLTPNLRTPNGYTGFFHCAKRKGYSGVGIYSRQLPKNVTIGIGNPLWDDEGRFIRADFESVSVISVYVPSGSSGEIRQTAKYEFLDELFTVLCALQKEQREFIVCGDWNIAHRPIDLKNWKGNIKNSGFLPEERAWLDKLYENGWLDVYRLLYPEISEDSYTWWSNRGQAYAKNVGWRIDLQIATAAIAKKASTAGVYKGLKFSDHAPLLIDYDFDL